MATIFYAVVQRLGTGEEIKSTPTDNLDWAQLQLGETPRRVDARIVPLTEATPDRVAEVQAIRAAYDALEFTSTDNAKSAGQIAEARRLLRSLLRAGG